MAYHINEELGDIYYEVIGDQLILKIRDGILGRGCDIYIIKSDDATVPSDDTVFSSKRTLEEIERRAGEGDGYWEMKEDSSGNKYIYTEYPMVSQYGATFYAGTPIEVGSIYEGLPIDNDTIYWSEVDGVKILKSKGGEGGDLNADKLWKLLGAATSEQINYAHLTNAFDAFINVYKNSFVTIGEPEQDISVIKNFIGGISIGENKHKLYEKDGVVYLDGDFVVTGGITQYALGNTPVSTIMDGVAVDGTTISKEGGVLKVIGGTGGGEMDAATILSKLLTVDGANSGLDADLLDGTHKADLFTSMSSSRQTNLSVTIGGTTKTISSLHADYAYELANSVTLWGQSFDGTNNVGGSLSNVGNIVVDVSSTVAITPYLSDFTDGAAWYGLTFERKSSNVYMHLNGYYGVNIKTSKGITCFTADGAVGIGITSPTEKLHIAGNTRIDESLIVGGGSSLGYKANIQGWVRCESMDCYGSRILRKIGFTNAEVLRYGYDTTDFIRFSIPANSTYSTKMELRGNEGLKVFGNILATGGITQYSDQRAKTIIEQITLPLQSIAKSPAVRFKWNGWKQQDDGKTHIGGIA